MSAQLDLFRATHPALPAHAARARQPASITRKLGAPYRPTDPKQAQRIILELCHAAGAGWVEARRMYRTTCMHPREVAHIAHAMTRAGVLDETHLYYGRSTPGTAGYSGFQYGYRLAQQVAA